MKKKQAPRRWPGRPGQPRPSIPARAEERITQWDEDGLKRASEFWLDGACVGRAYWNPDGTPNVATGLRDGAPVGYQIEYHDHGFLYAEPFVDGLHQGWAKQYGRRGRLLLMSPFKRGTGTDYWCDEKGRLAEEHPLVAGKPSGWERWWWEDQQTVYSETHWHAGEWHGITRHWTGGKLDRGYPKFFIHQEQVSKRAYLAAARTDPTLPPYRPEDDSPERPLPERFLELRRLTRSRAIARRRNA
ncbi:hypothetical protein HPC49_06550 [Pyxidicoccus fallax]|uniref:MORN repeat-containing protein n=1 Tax=Pyxidicoccus fallax TaxID=394095 RepID=A0A848LF24_9BACT|nr:hypothetical protein [Pyxidicoccus fallax]NMO17387.1 hypothetical protein [Pyxidicoccus fallax]NPC77914.1 hypothetical protein [Pyxidicoccus fallax]